MPRNRLLLLLILTLGCDQIVVPPPPPVDVEVKPVDEILAVNEKLLRLHNGNRTSPLSTNVELTVAAQQHANWMAANRRMSHRGEGGSSPSSRIKAAGYAWVTYGENVAYGQPTPEEVMRVWMNSLGHRRNIKNNAFDGVGFGHAKSSSGQIYWCVTFGSRGFNGFDEWDEAQAAPNFEGETDESK